MTLEESFLAEFSNVFPIEIQKIDKRLEFKFACSSHLTGFINDSGIGIRVDYEGTCIDYFCWIDTYHAQDERGRYYESMCVEEYRVYYNTKEELFLNQFYNPFFEWCKENLIVGNFLLMVDFGSSYAKILKPEEVNSQRILPKHYPKELKVFLLEQLS